MESAKLNLIKQELDRLDQLINTDISVIRDKIEVASREFLEAQYVVTMMMSRWSITSRKPFDAHCCHMDTAKKHPLSDRVKPSFVIFDIWAL